MPEQHQNKGKLPAAEAQQEAAQTSDAEAEAAGIATASDELSENDLEAVAGRTYTLNAPNPNWNPLKD
ncbi:hypothetical protein [Falsiroseomonas sp.]|uniref:hypothetical protein n=1 Tax=Falsiroseomonas sp. TaxID=2870721 RepID=UPI0034A435B7